MNIQNIKGRNQRMLTLTKYQCEVLRKLGLYTNKEYSLQDIIEILPESIKAKDGRFYYLECSNMCKLDWVDEEHILSKFG